MLDLTQFILNGLAMGSLYALIAVGYSMVFGVLKLVNFAHGEIFMLGAYAVMLCVSMGSSLWVALFIALVSVGFTAVFIERFAYKPLRNERRLAPLITTVGVSLFLQNFVQIVFSPNTLNYPVQLSGEILELGEELFIRQRDIGIFALAVLVTLSLELFIRFTRPGKAIRALAMNADAAKLCGVSIDRTISLTFFIGASVAVLVGSIQGMVTNQIFPLMGVSAGLKAFAAAVIGGIGDIRGSLIGGLCIGIAESILVGYSFSSFKEGFVFFLFIVVLLLRPQGIFGKAQLVKV